MCVCVCVCACVCVFIIQILFKAKSADGGNDFIFWFSIFNIHVIHNPVESSM